MPEGKHTPGEWANWGEDEVPDGIPVLEIARGEGGTPECRQIAYVQPSMTDDGAFYLSGEDYANARLISSAPDLLEALEMFVGSVTKRTENGNIYALGELHEAEEAARKAISKAKGEV